MDDTSEIPYCDYGQMDENSMLPQDREEIAQEVQEIKEKLYILEMIDHKYIEGTDGSKQLIFKCRSSYNEVFQEDSVEFSQLAQDSSEVGWINLEDILESNDVQGINLLHLSCYCDKKGLKVE